MRSTEETDADLETIRARKNALEQEVKSLRDLNEKLAVNAETLHEDLERMRDGRPLKQTSGTEGIKESERRILEQTITGLTAQKRALQEEYVIVKDHNKVLKATVTRYQKELRELQQVPSFTDHDLDRIDHGRKLRN